MGAVRMGAGEGPYSRAQTRALARAARKRRSREPQASMCQSRYTTESSEVLA